MRKLRGFGRGPGRNAAGKKPTRDVQRHEGPERRGARGCSSFPCAPNPSTPGSDRCRSSPCPGLGSGLQTAAAWGQSQRYLRPPFPSRYENVNDFSAALASSGDFRVQLGSAGR